MAINYESLVDDLIRELGSRPNTWINFRDLALRILGDADRAELLASVAAYRTDLFVIHDDARVRLREQGARRASQQLKGSAQNPKQNIEDAVREYLRQLQPVRIRVIKADPGQQILERYVHALSLELSDDDPKLSDDTPVELVSDGRHNPGHVVGTSRDESLVYVAFRFEVSHQDVPGILEVNRSQSFVEIANRLATMSYPPQLWDALNTNIAISLVRDNSHDLAIDLLNLQVPWTRLLWGPPGSGKTHCLAYLAAKLAESEASPRILILAPSNVAVDNAMFELVNALEQDGRGRDLLSRRKVFRFGYPRDERILSRGELFGPPELHDLSRAILATYKEIKSLKENRSPERTVAETQAKLKQLQETRKSILANYLSTAQIVATTIASAFAGISPISNDLRLNSSWDAVIVDEASMVNGALVVLLSSLARSRFLLVGDPRQLGPVFEWQKTAQPPDNVIKWLQKDPYELTGISTGLAWQKNIKDNDGRMARILAQRRCHPRIWQLTAALYPFVVSNVDIIKLNSIAAVPPLPSEPVVFLDLSSGRKPVSDLPETASAPILAVDYESACRRVGRSWENPPTAMLTIDIAREIRAHSPNASIAIITPYRGQVKLIRHWLYDEIQTDKRLINVEVGTVHSFQGGEADVVILDIVDGPPRPTIGALLRDDTGMRLMNVAITRARGKLIIIAHKDWLRGTDPSRAGLLWNVLFGGNSPKPCYVLPLAQSNATGKEEILTESPIEEIFVKELRRRTVQLPEFTLQHRIFGESQRIVSRADIAFVEQRLAIYCDGAKYHLQKDQWQRDLKQRRELARLGWRVLAFTGAEINANVAKCAEEVIAVLSKRNE